MDQMNHRIEGLLVFQQLSQPVIDRMNNEEGTSNHGGQSAYGRLTKLEFPKFNGEDVQGWLYRVNMFFTMDRIQEDAQKLINGNNVTWIQYEAAIKERFDPVNEDPMVELKNLKQVGSVQAYQDSFEVLLNKVDQPEAYAISLFIGGFKDEIGLAMRMIRPTKLTDVYSLAKMQEATLAIPKSSPGHKCSGQMYCLEVAGCKEEIKDEDCVGSELDQVVVREEEVMPQVSLNAMNGVNSY
ncbi:hypothetical protein Tco_1119941 [Tanacetum coccineum]